MQQGIKRRSSKCGHSLKRLSLAIAGLLAALSFGPAQALDTESLSVGHPERFGSYGENFAIYRWMRNNGWAEDDEPALRAHYSLAYVFSGRTLYDFLFSYTGEFDFYVGTRRSGPVINRISNPALHLRFPDFPNRKPTHPELVDRTKYGQQMLDIGLEHESDGQTGDILTDADRAAAEIAYATRNRQYFDEISHGSNFISVSGELPQQERFFSMAATLRLYLTQDYSVSWGPLAHRHVDLADYNLLRATLRRYQPRLGTFEAKWTIGKGGFKYQSFDLAWQIDSSEGKWAIPLYVRWHHGPLNTLSNFTQRQDSIGVGLRFAGF